jgi:hypothetical protein
MTQPISPAPDENGRDPLLQYSTGGGTVVTPRPSEQAYPLRQEEFLTLCDGEGANAAAQWRNFCLAWFLSAVIGLAGLWGSVDFDQAVKTKRMSPVVWALALGLMVLVSLCLTLFFHFYGRKQQGAGPYTRLKKKIGDIFNATHGSTGVRQGAEPGLSSMRDRLVIQSAKYGVDDKWNDVVDVLRAKIHDGALRVQVTNEELGPDPAKDIVKSLRVSYIFDGKNYDKTVPEHSLLCIPDNSYL